MLELRITEPGLSRYGLNRLYSGMHWTKRKSHADYWHSRIGWELKKIKAEMFESPVFIEFEFETGMDIDNCGYLIKLVIDGLKGIVIHDDSKKYVAGYSAVHGKEKGILIRIREIKNTSIIDRLAAYEEIGLAPEEIKNILETKYSSLIYKKSANGCSVFCAMCGEKIWACDYYEDGLNYCPNCGAKMTGENCTLTILGKEE